MKTESKNLNNEERESYDLEAIKLIGNTLSAIANEDRIQIMKYIGEEKKITFKEAKNRFDLTNSKLNYHLQELKKQKIIRQKLSRGPYILTELGEVNLHFFEKLKQLISEV